MTRAIEKAQPSRLAQVSGFSDSQISLIKQTIAPDASRLELAWLLYQARVRGLEPIAGEIYAIRYSKDGPLVMVPGINGYRKQAAATDEYAGSDDPVFEYVAADMPEDAKTYPSNAPSKATVTVWRIVKGQRVPFTASCRWSEFAYDPFGKLLPEFKRRPHNQLGVRAESHALRKGFPREMAELEREQAPPPAWAEAAETDIVIDADAAAANARMYDTIFEDQDRIQKHMDAETRKAKEPRSRRAPQVQPELESPQDEPEQEEMSTAEIADTTADSETRSPWDAYRELAGQAARLRIRVRTLRNDTPLEEVDVYNRELGEQIEAEWQRRQAAEQNRTRL